MNSIGQYFSNIDVSTIPALFTPPDFSADFPLPKSNYSNRHAVLSGCKTPRTQPQPRHGVPGPAI